MEICTYLARDDERNRLDQRSRDFVRARDLAFGYVEGATGEEAHPSLRSGGLVFGETVERVGLVFVVSDVTIAK